VKQTIEEIDEDGIGQNEEIKEMMIESEKGN